MSKPTLSDQEIDRQLDEYLHVTNAVTLPPGVRTIDAAALERQRFPWKNVVIGSIVFAGAAASVVGGVAVHYSSARPAPAGHSAPSSAAPVATSAPTPSSGPTPLPTTAPTPDPVADWKPLSNRAGNYSFRVPPGWQVSGPCVNAGQAAGDPVGQEVRTGPTASACGADVGGNIEAFSYPGSKNLYDVTQPYYAKSVTNVTVDGVRGTRTVLTPNLSGPYSRVVTYVFVYGGRVYDISDVINPADTVNGTAASPDLTATLDLLMTKTWHFRP